MAMFRTALLFALLTGIFLAIGYLLGGTAGIALALVLAFAMNFISYWYSDKIVLAMYGAKEVPKAQNQELYKIVGRVAENADIPMPKVYMVDTDVPNAFATGRSTKHAAVAVTRGIMRLMNDDELEGVLSHEISHVKNHDTLTSTMAATIGGALAYLAQMAWFGVMFSGGNRREGSGNSIILLPLLILAPLAATLVQLAISRTREFKADNDGAILSKKPLSLASALGKIESSVGRIKLKGNPATSQLWIVNPFRGDAFVSLFSTHPPTSVRIQRLKELSEKIK